MSGSAVDNYIAAAPEHFRPALTDLRAAIRAHLTMRGVCYEEVISYAMPGYRLTGAGKPGAMVAGFAAHRHQCGFYPHSGSVLPRLAAAIGARGHTKSALHFTPDDPLPPALLASVLDARLDEIGL